jgi:hypothetical protein
MNETIFIPEDIIKIGPNGGNIGRFYWENQATFRAEQIDKNNFRETAIGEAPGYSTFIWTRNEWVGWLMGGYVPPLTKLTNYNHRHSVLG